MYARKELPKVVPQTLGENVQKRVPKTRPNRMENEYKIGCWIDVEQFLLECYETGSKMDSHAVGNTLQKKRQNDGSAYKN